MTDLTTAVGFAVESGDAESVSRWTKKGDRLYVNDLTGNWDAGYVDLQTGEVEDAGTNVSGEATVDGDTLTIEYVAKEYGISYTDTHEYTVVVEIDWGATQPDDDDNDTETDDIETTPAVDPETHEVADGVEAGAEVIHDGERKTIESVGRRNIRFEDGSEGAHEDCDLIVADELLTDGGQPAADETHEPAERSADGATEHIPDDVIQSAIEQHDDPSHPDAVTVDEARKILGAIQRSYEAVWSEHMDSVEEGVETVITVDDDVIVFADHSGLGWHEEFRGVELADVDLDQQTKSVIKQVHHTLATERIDYSWEVSDPFVVASPEGFGAGQETVESVMAWLRSEGCSPGQAWHYYGVEICGHSQSEWARRGHGDRSAISKAISNAEAKITR
ncbi:hypothetical protein [Halobacterium salinarum]|uniref:hypothetical protein n=1 Tax=Halobacterium salinarum TaxID=2242 RepID=UPI002554B4BE|nr:hypothetical protein [Halobacterium salinarum]MDL0133541.1 hypothetical protein [Halobacterium salinarum]